ncbi:MAG: L-2-amino-thiazoline-4-carboxylic acid hydrolase [Lachnospiraceae bacterium]|nr:L-2-amino-thiazoline-4-carboxylic acid hydrolase [Ruminococcus sp.]MCM1276309.1 L-2-amino-thiazoline-4-carboxylic acid hydrolase [Lachnospiraceae bacterium]
MKNKRQAEIKAFLIRKFGEKGGVIFEQQEALFRALIEKTSGKSESQMKTLTQTILPVVAMYKALAELEPENAMNTVRKYMINVVGAAKNGSMKRMERVPGFFDLYGKIFLKVMRTSDLWSSTQKRGEGYFDVTITKCLWHDSCVENGCPELCKLFCDVDDVTYGGLNKMKFSRTSSLGFGGDCCDFHFSKK